MTTARRAAVALGIAYIAGMGVLFIRGAGILAAYLTMPAWLLVGALSLRLTPGSTFDTALSSWPGNLLLLLVSAVLNVVCVYVIVRLVSKAMV